MLGFCYDFRVKEGDSPANEIEKVVLLGDGRTNSSVFPFYSLL